MSANNKLTFVNTALEISNKLHRIVQKVVSKHELGTAQSIIINFKDSNYSAEQGGFHPVEICFQRDSNNQCSYLYITDFSFSGGPYPELDRDLDFDIGNNSFFARHSGWQNINSHSVREMYKLWEGNFLAFYDMDAFDNIKVRCH